jgi:ubiquinone/menaquinone biosynthesis C-methylase UbiE
MSRIDGFNRIAPFYDILATLIFFGRIFRSQIHFLPLIPPGSNVLILGGGSGRILRALLVMNPGVKVWYLEASSAMISQASRRVGVQPEITFIHGTENDLPQNISFDAVIAPFFFDLFQGPDLSGVVNRLLDISSINSLWLVTDFVNHAAWHRPLLLLMYRAFNIMCGVTARRLPDWEEMLESNGLQLHKKKSFCAGFILTKAYRVVTHS